jgi:hypothetical protein
MSIVRSSFSTTLLVRQRFLVCLSFVPGYFKPAGQRLRRPGSRNGDYAQYSNTFCWWVQPRSLMSLQTFLPLHIVTLMSLVIWTIWFLSTKRPMHYCMFLFVRPCRWWWRGWFMTGRQVVSPSLDGGCFPMNIPVGSIHFPHVFFCRFSWCFDSIIMP